MKYFVIYVPGLGDKRVYAGFQKAAVGLWRTSGVQPYYFLVHWANASETYDQKLQRLLKTIDTAHAKGYTVSLVAASAGASLILTALSKRKDKIHRAVAICGKLRNAGTVSEALFALNPAFKDSLQAYSRIEPTLTATDRKKILIARAARDVYVPAADGEVEGAATYVIPSMGHVVSVFMALTFFRRAILRFVKAQ